MKTRYTSALLIAVTLPGMVMAQRLANRPSDQTPFAPSEAAEGVRPLPPAEDGARDAGDIVWSEDFGNGLAGNNPSGAWTVDGANGNIWRISTTGPLGFYTPANQRIQSTTFANGFAKFASDSANCTWVGNTPTNLPVADFTNWEGSLVSPVIDLSATPFVEISYQQRSRFCCGTSPFFLEVSTDGGATWPTRFLSNQGLSANQTPTATETRRFNISNAIAANPANVRFRFHHDSAEGTSHYHWQVDDIAISELYAYDLVMNGTATTRWEIATAATYDSLYYTIYPFSQLRPIGLNMTALNNGSMEQSDVVANFKVQRGADVVLDQDQIVSTMAPGEISTIFVDPGFTPPAVAGAYNVTTLLTGLDDQTPLNNSGSASFNVHRYYYGRDDNATGTTFNEGDALGGTFVIGNMFYVATDDVLYGIAVAFNSGTEEGIVVRGQLLDANQSAFPVIETTPEYSILPTDLNNTGGSNFKMLMFDTPVQLVAGMDYMAAVQCFGRARVSLSGTSQAQTSHIFFNNPGDEQGETWYFTTRTPMVRMALGTAVGIEDLSSADGISLGQNMPNPATGTTSIAFGLESVKAVSFEVRDMSGKLILSRNEGRKPAGQHRIELDTQLFGEGVYFYTLTAGDVRLTKRMVIIH